MQSKSKNKTNPRIVKVSQTIESSNYLIKERDFLYFGS